MPAPALAPWDPPKDGSFARQMYIQRVRNPQDSTQWVDVAFTLGWVETRKRSDNKDPLPNERPSHHYHQTSQKDFQRFVHRIAPLYIGDAKDRSDPFTVTSEEDLRVRVEAFAAEHPD